MCNSEKKFFSSPWLRCVSTFASLFPLPTRAGKAKEKRRRRERKGKRKFAMMAHSQSHLLKYLCKQQLHRPFFHSRTPTRPADVCERRSRAQNRKFSEFSCWLRFALGRSFSFILTLFVIAIVKDQRSGRDFIFRAASKRRKKSFAKREESLRKKFPSVKREFVVPKRASKNKSEEKSKFCRQKPGTNRIRFTTKKKSFSCDKSQRQTRTASIVHGKLFRSFLALMLQRGIRWLRRQTPTHQPFCSGKCLLMTLAEN